MIGEDMASYYKTRDHYKGPTCLLTLVHCDRDCTGCTFAGAAYAQAIKEKRKRKEGKE